MTCWKCPLDLWSYQQIIFATRPQAVIECGVAKGGTTLFLADLLDIKFGNKGMLLQMVVHCESTPKLIMGGHGLKLEPIPVIWRGLEMLWAEPYEIVWHQSSK